MLLKANNARIIAAMAERNNISLPTIAESVFGKEANKFLDFINNPALELQFSYSKLAKIAQKLYIPFGYLFLQDIPKETAKVAELRGKNSERHMPQSLKISIEESEYKQLWYRDYLISLGEEPKYTTKYSNESEIITAIQKITAFKGLPKNPNNALQKIIMMLQQQNLLIFIATNTNNKKSTKLSIDDFRGYCLYDEYAPVIFLHNDDSTKGKIFTILHELAHILYRKSGVVGNNEHSKIEKICNSIAGEILTSKDLMEWNNAKSVSENIEYLSKTFNLASNEAIATKARNLKYISQKEYNAYINEYCNKQKNKPYGKNTKSIITKRIIKANSKNFAEAIIVQTLNNKLDYNTAMDYLGIHKLEYFNKIKAELQI